MMVMILIALAQVGLLIVAYAQGASHERTRWEDACHLVINDPPLGVGADRVKEEHRAIAVRAVHAVALGNVQPPRPGAA